MKRMIGCAMMVLTVALTGCTDHRDYEALLDKTDLPQVRKAAMLKAYDEAPKKERELKMKAVKALLARPKQVEDDEEE